MRDRQCAQGKHLRGGENSRPEAGVEPADPFNVDAHRRDRIRAGYKNDRLVVGVADAADEAGRPERAAGRISADDGVVRAAQ